MSDFRKERFFEADLFNYSWAREDMSGHFYIKDEISEENFNTFHMFAFVDDSIVIKG